MKQFLGFSIFSTSAITAGKNMAYHQNAVGIGVNSEVSDRGQLYPGEGFAPHHLDDVDGRSCH